MGRANAAKHCYSDVPPSHVSSLKCCFSFFFPVVSFLYHLLAQLLLLFLLFVWLCCSHTTNQCLLFFVCLLVSATTTLQAQRQGTNTHPVSHTHIKILLIYTLNPPTLFSHQAAPSSLKGVLRSF